MKTYFLSLYIILLIQFSPQECTAALMVKESAKLEHISTRSPNKNKRNVVRKKKYKRKRGFRKKWRSFWKKGKAKIKSFFNFQKSGKTKKDKRKLEVFSFLSFLITLVPFIGLIANTLIGISALMLICLLLALIFAIIGLRRIKKNPDIYTGRVFAVLTLVICFFGLLLLFALVMALANSG